MNPFTWLKRPKRRPLYHVTIYMKSGNEIHLYDIEGLDYKYSGNEIVTLKIVNGDDKWLTRLATEATDISQIEAITSRRTR